MDKAKIKQEFYTFLAYGGFLALFFCAMVTYEGLMLKKYSISYFHYGYAFFQAAILSKMILLGEALGIGKRWEDQPLIYPTLYRTVVFTLFVLALTILEHFLHGLIFGKPLYGVYQEILEKGIYLILAKTIVISFVLFLLFAFVEISETMGEDKLIRIFFRKR